MDASIHPIDRVAFELGPITVYWYGVIIGLGALLGLWIAVRESERRGLGKDMFVDVVMWAVPIAIICARIYYVAFEWDFYSKHPEKIIAIWEGGIAIHGALIGSFLTAFIFSKIRGISFWKLADIAAPSIILGQGIGRWGNFMNQEAHGGPVSRSFLENTLHLPDFIVNQMYINGTYYHPTFLYESLWDLAGFVILMLLRKANLKRGELFFSYVIWYSIGRFFVEGLRTDSLMLTSTLRIAQVISLVLIAVSIILIIYRRKAGLSEKRYLEG
ncbi:prolipoprotein diacylglyceryl transferase [Fictibacillus sp. WQ 8-8]|uniref:prolipoprotein diacylglyceryl transferase n=1 Tax=unclassified Fictibacillus TaxID=2644029 RepID=UPI0008E01F53|nr:MULTISPECIES: prolipoprotein diacylglyceryl transferase [unclassified Fictibacillus]MCQ6264310.1 prolipoprotein diacylglyceryl transferase [Fictibacillus sp. WQ 8-8]MED2971643.1 prolipoprotein diacylglyceryl transferase [Fictibacillus sp. B-59209]UZJ79778.1 prolipoprotein diacylglyceryl transferase [Fictibacillus sp. KU28468]SFD44001.1 Prolipoprotein diacylglyceryl transferase [Bacillus sp. OV194]